MSQLKDEQFFIALDPEANSVAILVKHLAGNMRSRFTDFLTTDGEKPNRLRDGEFELTPATSRADVMKWWEDGWTCVFAAIDPLQPEDVLRTVPFAASHTRFCKPSTARSHITPSTSAKLCSWPSICGRASGRR